MKLCRFDEDRLGVVKGDMVHDVTAAQDEIRKSARYDMKGDAVIAALPQWRSRIEEMAAKAPGKPLSSVKLLSPVARPSKAMAAPTNYKKHIEEMRSRTDLPKDATRMPPNIEKAGIFLKANSSIVGPSRGHFAALPRSAERARDRARHHHRQAGHRHPEGQVQGLHRRLRARPRHDHAAAREDRSFRKSIDGYSVIGPWMVTADEVANPDDMLITLHCNDELRQTADTKDLIYDCGRLIEFASSFYTLYPGDVYFTGTPHGVGPVKAGDTLYGTQ